MPAIVRVPMLPSSHRAASGWVTRSPSTSASGKSASGKSASTSGKSASGKSASSGSASASGRRTTMCTLRRSSCLPSGALGSSIHVHEVRLIPMRRHPNPCCFQRQHGHHGRHHHHHHQHNHQRRQGKNVLCASTSSASGGGEKETTGGGADLAPVPLSKREWNAADLAALWIGMIVCVPAYQICTSLVTVHALSMTQALIVVLLGNAISLAPMVLQGHAGVKYGISFPVHARAVYGHRGSHVATFLRGSVACGWFGIQTYVGGMALYQLVDAVVPTLNQAILASTTPDVMGLAADKFASLFAFWLVQVFIVVRGMGAIQILERVSAPVLGVLCTLLLCWAANAASTATGQPAIEALKHVSKPLAPEIFIKQLGPTVTAFVGFWATLALNISDFTRLATSHRASFVGQGLGLPIFSVAFATMAIGVTACTVSAFGTAIADPVALVGRVASGSNSNITAAVLSLIGLMVATLSTNIAANVVAPANALSNAFPNAFSTFARSGMLVCSLGIASMPWKWADTSAMITWLLGYSVILAPVLGIMLVDYFIVNGRSIDVDELYVATPKSRYFYWNGFHVSAILCTLLATLVNVPGLLHALGVLNEIPTILLKSFEFSWFTGVGFGALLYWFVKAIDFKGFGAYQWRKTIYT